LDLVIEWGWRSLVLAVGVMALADHWPRASAATRYQIGWVTLALVIALPLLPLLPDAPATEVDAKAAGATGLVSIESVPSSVVMAGLCAFALWTFVGIVRLVTALAALHRVRATCRPFPPALEAGLTAWTRHRARARGSRLVLSGDVRGAAVFGLWPPLVAVSPVVAAQLTPAELDRIVVHELAHVARRDDWADLVQLVIRAFAGWHPAVWWLDRRLRAEREAACDDWVVALTDGAIPYAASLVKLAEIQGAGRRLQLAPGALGRSALTARVDRLLDRRQNRAICGSRPVVLSVAILACGLGIQLSSIDLVATRTLASHALETLVPERLLAHVDRRPEAQSTNMTPDERRPAPPTARSSTDRRRAHANDDVPAGADREPIAAKPLVGGAPAREPIATPTMESETIHAADLPVAATPLGSHVLTRLPVAPAPVSLTQRNDRPQTPWGAAADGGIAIGEGSRKAAVATAGFFTRFGKSIGGSF
jgi:beta-lactamase regulating signal transducer with metallopeptidase domain